MDIIGSFVPFFVKVLFLVVGAIILTKVAAGLTHYVKNNNAPVENLPVKAVAKRANVSHMSGTQDMPATSDTTYYVTFEFASGKRQEFRIKGRAYGLIAEGDSGILTFQGTRFLEFNRQGEEHE